MVSYSKKKNCGQPLEEKEYALNLLPLKINLPQFSRMLNEELNGKFCAQDHLMALGYVSCNLLPMSM